MSSAPPLRARAVVNADLPKHIGDCRVTIATVTHTVSARGKCCIREQLFQGTTMTIKKLGQLRGVDIVRIVDPVGVRLRCEFVSLKHPTVEFEMSGDLALGIAKEMEMLLPLATRKQKSKAKPKRGPKGAKARRKS
jgi:hypothetical protein